MSENEKMVMKDWERDQKRFLRLLGERLRDLRKARQLRQVDMMSYDLNYKYYQRLESGQVNPTLLTLTKVAIALKVSIHDLFRLEPDRLRCHDHSYGSDKTS